MSGLTLLILRLVFLAVLWAFVFAIVYALRTDLFGQKVRRMPADAAAGPFAQAPSAAPQPTAPAPPLNSPPMGSPTASTTQIRSGGSRGAAAPATGNATRLLITSGPKEGLEIELPNEQLTIGRSGESGLVIRDDYTSTHHARLMLWNDGWVVQDLDSTNGTYLAGKRVTVPTPIPMNTPIKIGTTTFELRR
ncbi:type III secretion system (T3SS) inner membrane Yop/YscD-like protein [Glaciihabitans tibetensis]|uniref:Type III secretion system (T3SS) inner membrane Yop/YscD-like protein n=1 Tax=Glaciihabitans tibetensis TaxID=1266600 RepID=A0A2T0VCN5_9MICO|nr:FHA domain-containing protein [Glaciihabitans tibetensis]PRY67946.1 type III secretion system (T3SS) inner membrane Yop/YscD-like protein [Glaciihabitans tibetensis]